jgi:hypothetical protein
LGLKKQSLEFGVYDVGSIVEILMFMGLEYDFWVWELEVKV